MTLHARTYTVFAVSMSANLRITKTQGEQGIAARFHTYVPKVSDSI